jgi:hypothetical protein
MRLTKVWLRLASILLLLASVLSVAGVVIATRLPFEMRGAANGVRITHASDKISMERRAPSGFITFVFRYSFGLCATLNERAIWEPGDTVDKLYAHLTADTSVVIHQDGQRLTFASGDVIAIQNRNIVSGVVDSTGRIAGTYSLLTFCWTTPEHHDSLHAASIRIRSTSGVERTQSWLYLVRGES